MPIYEYVCESCGRFTEVMQKVSDPPPAACQECGGSLAKLVSRTSFQLKGGGWYADLYSSSSRNTEGGSPAKKAEPATPAAPSPAPAKPSGGGDGGAPSAT